jgi:hypothetical protein
MHDEHYRGAHAVIANAVAVLCAAATLEGSGLLRAARWLMYASAGLAFAGLLGIPLGDMNVRNIGIVGYAAAFPLAAALLGRAYGPGVRR